MKILITGSRNIKDKGWIKDILKQHIKQEDIVIQGGATGVDIISADWCLAKGISKKTIRPTRTFKPYYLHRNAEMVGMCDKVLALWDGVSRGTEFTINYAKSRDKLWKIIIYK